MPGYLISLNGNTLYLSKSEGIEEVFSSKLPSDVVKESQILSVPLFSESLGQLILDSYGDKAEKLPFTFLVEPEDVHLSFITVTQKDKNDDTALMHEASKKLAATALTLDDVYFSYQKIAPFVYQFVAVKKESLEKYLEVSNTLGFELKSVLPWISILPRSFCKDGKPAIFIVDNDSTKSLVLTELGGVYHIGSLEKDLKNGKVSELVEELSVYQRKEPINTVYTFNIEKLDVTETFDVTALEFENIHQLVSESMDFDVSAKQINLLNLLPVPVVQKNNSLVYVGAAVAVALLIGGFAYLNPFNFNIESSDLIGSEHDVLSESQEATPSIVEEDVVQEEAQENEETVTEEEVQEEETVDLNKAYLRVRVENGTNIPGLAGNTRDHLTPFGYEIVAVADSVKSDVPKTIVEVSKDTELYTELLKTDLLEFYDDVEITVLPDGEYDYDVLITAGTNLKE